MSPPLATVSKISARPWRKLALAKRPLAIYSDLPSWVAREVALEPLGFLFLPYETNTLAFQKLGIKSKRGSAGARIYAGENISSIERAPGDYIVVFSPFETEELRESADLLLPLPWFWRRKGPSSIWRQGVQESRTLSLRTRCSEHGQA